MANQIFKCELNLDKDTAKSMYNDLKASFKASKVKQATDTEPKRICVVVGDVKAIKVEANHTCTVTNANTLESKLATAKTKEIKELANDKVK